MAKLSLTLACNPYDRVQPLIAGSVQPDGVALNFISSLSPGEIFWRMLRHEEFDVSELSLSAYILGLARGDTRFVAIPVFLLRLFRHSYIWVREDAGIERPEDLKGKRVLVPEYHMTALLYIRGALKHDYGVLPEDLHWVRTRVERVDISVPPGVVVEDMDPETTVEDLMASGTIDATAGTRPPRGPAPMRRLFPNFREVEADYYRRTHIFPIMHVLAIRRPVYEANPWLALNLMQAFEQAKAQAYERLHEVSGIYALPWLNSELQETRAVFGEDAFPYGVEPNRASLDAATLFSHEQGLSERRLSIDELFAPETVDVFVEP
jgi:4,5-dihydroxyphthalate decarboxylase